MKEPVKLPDLPSELVRVAREDLIKVMTDPAYSVDMCDWHSWNARRKRCSVCQAGAVMAKSLGVPLTANRYPHEDDVNEFKLRGLDYLRGGNVEQFLTYVGRGTRYVNVASIEVGYVAFGDDADKYLDWLKKVEQRLIKLGL